MSDTMPLPTDKPGQATHRVTWDGDTPTFHCAGNEASPCHSFPDCDCEMDAVAKDHDANHPNVPHVDTCWVISWLSLAVTAAEAEETWVSDEAPPASMPKMDGEIDWEWDCDVLLWWYAESDDLAASGRVS